MIYWAVEGAGLAGFAFFGFLGLAAGLVVVAAAGASAAIGAADFGMSAAIAAAAIPTDNKAEAINFPDVIMRSPQW